MYVMKALLAVGLVYALGASGAFARETPQSPYAGEERRSIKALSPQEIADLRNGAGMGLSKVAELNRYPGPRHVLDLAAQLELAPAQAREVETIQADMRREARRLGEAIIEKEAELEALFASRRADEKRAATLLDDIGRLWGRLRWVHVKAHLETARLLSPAQIAAYDRERGYAGATGGAHRHRH